MNWDAGIGLCRDGVLRVPGRPPVERPDLAGCYDLFGFSYYATMGVAHGQVVRYPTDAPVSPLGYGIWAGGLGLVLDRLHEELPGTPLLIDEYGIGTADDTERVAYLEDGLRVVHEALGRGIDVRGIFHWTAVDNYEWLHGYDVAVRPRRPRPPGPAERRRAGGRSPRRALIGAPGTVVGEAGLEPAHPFGHRNLNPARLPIPPLARVTGQE